MAFERLSSSIEELKESVQAYFKSSAEYYKLLLFKHTMKGATALIVGLLLLFLFFFVMVFLSVAVAIVISEAMDSASAGFFIVAGFYFLLVLFVLAFGKKLLEKTMLKKVSRKIFND